MPITFENGLLALLQLSITVRAMHAVEDLLAFWKDNFQLIGDVLFVLKIESCRISLMTMVLNLCD